VGILLLVMLAALGRWCGAVPGRLAKWWKKHNPYRVHAIGAADSEESDSEEQEEQADDDENKDEQVEVPWLDSIERGHPDGTYIELAGANGLAKADLLGASDPYAVVYFNDECLGKTRVRKNTLEPVWNERFGIRAEARDHNTLRIELFDYDRFSADDFMGQVVLTGRGLSAFPTDFTELPIEKTTYQTVRECLDCRL
jgi:hypothetical protein